MKTSRNTKGSSVNASAPPTGVTRNASAAMLNPVHRAWNSSQGSRRAGVSASMNAGE